jgi:polysaccharide biosynthesis protein PelF
LNSRNKWAMGISRRVEREATPGTLRSRGARRVLFVFSWLVVGGEETEVRLLTRNIDPARYRIDVVACFRKPTMPEQTHQQLLALGIDVDCTPYSLSFEDTIEYLVGKIPGYDVVVACQAVPDVYPALERIGSHPPLIEHGGLVSEATAGPKHRTARYVGVCAQIREAAASRMPERPHHALEIPSMVDLAEFNPADRAWARMEMDAAGEADDVPLFGWVGRLDRKKRVEDFIRAASMVLESGRKARFVVIGGPDAFMPEYAEQLRDLACELRLDRALWFMEDRPDVPRLMAGLDALVWLSRGEGMPHVIAEAGAACLPVVATRDNGSEEQITDGETGLFVPHESPRAVSAAMVRLMDDPELGRRLGRGLRAKVDREYSAEVVTGRWEALFDEVIAEAG